MAMKNKNKPFLTELLPATNQTQKYVNMHLSNGASPNSKDNTVPQQEGSSPSATVLQSVVSNSDQHTSTYCQYTSPVCCSVNTHQIMSSEPYPHLGWFRLYERFLSITILISNAISLNCSLNVFQ